MKSVAVFCRPFAAGAASMHEVLLGKAAIIQRIIERCRKRIGEMYPGHEQSLGSDVMRQLITLALPEQTP